MPVAQLEALASRSDVRGIRQAPLKWTNVGSLSTQGYITHRANSAVALGQIGAGVKVGGIVGQRVSCPGGCAGWLGGDLGPGTTVLPGQAGPADGTDEGAAMMEIVQVYGPRLPTVLRHGVHR